MRVLLTGSSGWLGRHLAPLLRQAGHVVVGLDPQAGPETAVIGSVADRLLLDRLIGEHGIDSICHAGALHKPDIIRRPASDFVEVNVQGTLAVLEAAVAANIRRVVVTSTTSLMISRAIRAGREGGARQAAWLDEDMAPLAPRNIYGVTKLAAEQLCRMIHDEHGLPIVVIRTSRFFPEEDDMAHAIPLTALNTKANELLYRRLTVQDAARAHLLALERATDLGFDILIASALTPFQPCDAVQLLTDAPAVVERYFPRYRQTYARHGWRMAQSIDRVYDASRIQTRLGFRCAYDFPRMLDDLLEGPAKVDGPLTRGERWR